MISPLERAARALYERFPHGQLIQDAQGKQAITGIPWEQVGVTSRQRFIDDARAVIEELRELHDDAIIDQMGAAAKAADTIASATGWKGEPYRFMALASHVSMIDALLGEHRDSRDTSRA